MDITFLWASQIIFDIWVLGAFILLAAKKKEKSDCIRESEFNK